MPWTVLLDDDFSDELDKLLPKEITMAITLEDKLNTLPIEEQQYIQQCASKLIEEEYALRRKEARRLVAPQKKKKAQRNLVLAVS